MKRFNKYRLLAMTMAAALALSACGGGQAGINGKESVNSTKATEQTATKESTSMADNENLPGTENQDDETTVSLIPLNVELSAKYEGEWDDKGPIITADSATIHVLDDGYEALKATLDEYNELNWQEVYTMFLEHREYAKEDTYSEDTELYVSREIEVTRADSKVLSFINTEKAYMGGAHGSYYANAEVYDAESGEKLELSDVVTDYDEVYEYVIDSLKESYEADLFFDGYEEWVHEMFYEPDGAMSSPLEWSMNADGLVFQFSPYIIGPWASGIFEVELPFEGNEKLFVEEYVIETDHPILSIEPNEAFTLDADGDGFEETYLLETKLVEETYSTKVMISKSMSENTNGLTGGSERSFEFYGNLKEIYLMTAEDGHKYLYLDFLHDNDFQMLEILDLSSVDQTAPEKLMLPSGGKMHVGDIGSAVYGHYVYDSEQFALYSRIYTLGTYSGFKTYSVGEDGMPVTEDEMYTIVNPNRDWETSLVSKKELTVLIHVDGSDERVEETLPKGTLFKPRKTGGETIMEMELEDGRRCDILLEKEEGYLYTINGISEYDCFENLPYAG